MYDAEELKEIEEFNKTVTDICLTQGTLYGEIEGRKYIIEVDCYRADDSIDGFMGWWDDDHGITTHADTPFEVYNDMP